MFKYLEQRRIKKQQRWEAEFDKTFREIMREEKLYGKEENNLRSIV